MSLKKGKEEFDHSGEVFHQEAHHKRNQRHYYRNLVLRSVATFCIGIVLMAFLEALGLGGLFCGLLLALCGFLLSEFSE